MENLKSYIESIRDWLRNLAEDRTLPMDVKVHDLLWTEIQSIDHDLETDFKDFVELPKINPNITDKEILEEMRQRGITTDR